MPTLREHRYYTLYRINSFRHASKRMELIDAKTIKDSVVQYKDLKTERKEEVLRDCYKEIRKAKEKLREDYELNKDRISYQAEVFLRIVKLYRL